ncbi:hypothetical protein KFL_014570010 [Klebsormidium nitens]|uniref:NrS-1 polymerase-like helicase domain-containing protein n=1 Tax=Klebsormidium nitens TaxID=105231 RepID=A0A1Y1IRP9_KLENI|nr:hypothetical protein KFL_014570010 [Klebsormidium nitens]|eukprot:GAQ93344.1 hypothetical protein KFL_014570010 [Klebsormidium nitens]
MQATGINPLLVLVQKAFPEDKQLYDAYYKRYIEVRKLMEDAKPPPQQLTEREAANWKTLDEITERRVELQRHVNRKLLHKRPEALTDEDKFVLFRHLILCLYSYQPAIRNDYSDCPIVRLKDIKTADAHENDEKRRKKEDDVRTSKAKLDLLDLALRIMNHYFAVVRSTKAVYLETIYSRDANGQLEPEETIHRSGRDFLEICRNFQLQSLSGKSKEVAKFWESSPKRREYDQIVFEPDPSKVSSRHFNLFSGLRFKPLDRKLTESELVECEGRMPKLMWHIRNILCDQFPERFEYNMKWMAHSVQRPWKKIGVALVFRGGQGSGKSSLWKFYGLTILGGKYYLYCNEIEKVIGKFNSLGANRLLIVFDEAGNWGGAFRMNDRIKSLITQEETCMERKGQDPISVDDKSNIVFTTNNFWPVKREADDRRYSCQQVSDAKMGNKQHFDELMDELEKPETAYHFHRYLSSIDITNWDPQKMPITAWGEGLKEHSIPPHVNMMQALLENGCFHPSLETWVASTDIKRTYDMFLLQLDIKEDRHTDINILIRSLNAIFNMRHAARSIQGVRTHKGWWFPTQGAICEALHKGKLLSSTMEWVDTWQRLDYIEDKEGPWMTDPNALEKLIDASKESRQSVAEQKCSFCMNHHVWELTDPEWNRSTTNNMNLANCGTRFKNHSWALQAASSTIVSPLSVLNGNRVRSTVPRSGETDSPPLSQWYPKGARSWQQAMNTPARPFDDRGLGALQC